MILEDIEDPSDLTLSVLFSKMILHQFFSADGDPRHRRQQYHHCMVRLLLFINLASKWFASVKLVPKFCKIISEGVADRSLCKQISYQ